ncbi:four helix bundle protein [Algoriphagus sp. CAU 1675]|uniref:four helix bundle protein n=1 Tax=Algoriphagus sp. CAU 1675 TaxID=3032597 RepID=UPI0023DAD625|nr:four helix bundle protein [Algoriphagus sp. CAU 1675]MDF2158198.1 four helix bundle protein [Algoriphagus sp. CAU 1675]
MTIKNFEELEVWQIARDLCVLVRRLTRNPEFSKDFRFCSQINSSSGSVMDNIAEGFERDGNKEFIQFLYVAKASSAETRSQSYRAHDAGFISLEEHLEVLKKTESLKYKIQGLIQTLKNSGGKGYK